jgi:hypothetical protein
VADRIRTPVGLTVVNAEASRTAVDRAADLRRLGQLRPIVVVASCKRGVVCPERHTQTAES